MVCRNCGSDLKPGIKYCLNCGEYLSKDEIDMLETGEDNSSKISESIVEIKDNTNYEEVKPKKSNLNKKTKDMIIYGVLFTILLASIIVMIVANSNKKTEKVIVEHPVTYQDNIVNMSDYKITFSGKLNYVIEGANVYITDDTNYIFSFKVVEGEYTDYTGDFLEKELLKSGNNVLANEIKTVDSRDFIIYTFSDAKKTRYLYVTEIDSTHVVMGNIEEKDGGNWSSSLSVIAKVTDSVEFKNASNNDTTNNGTASFDSSVIDGKSN